MNRRTLLKSLFAAPLVPVVALANGKPKREFPALAKSATRYFRTGRGTGRTTAMLEDVITAANKLASGDRILVCAATNQHSHHLVRRALQIAQAAGINAHVHQARTLCFHGLHGEVHVDFRSIAECASRGAHYHRQFVDHWQGD